MSEQYQVLIVDDSPTETARFERILQSNGFSTTAVTSGEQGVVIAARIKPHVILMDVVMGGMNGFQATRKITTQEATKHIPVIMVTTKDQTTDRVWAQRQGAKGYLTKPVNEQELLQTIATLMEQVKIQ